MVSENVGGKVRHPSPGVDLPGTIRGISSNAVLAEIVMIVLDWVSKFFIIRSMRPLKERKTWWLWGCRKRDDYKQWICTQNSLSSRISSLSRLTKMMNISIWQRPTCQWGRCILWLDRISNCFCTNQKILSKETNPTFPVGLRSVWYSSVMHDYTTNLPQLGALWFRPCFSHNWVIKMENEMPDLYPKVESYGPGGFVSG